MNDSLDNSTMIEDRARKSPKRLKDIAMMELIRMLIERFIPHILRSCQDIDSIGGFDAIREKILTIRDWIYESLSCSVANDVQKLIMKVLPQLKRDVRRLFHPSLKYVQLLALHPKCRNLISEFFLKDMTGDVIDMLQSLICLERIEWTVRLQTKEIDLFTTNIKYCTRLKIFVHKSNCDDNIIKVLLHNCPLLSVLDVYGSKSVTNESTQYLENMKLLRKCFIEGTSITIEGVIRILKKCTQLYQLDMSYNMCDILERLEDTNEPIQLSLRTVELRGHRHITPHLLKKYCPFLMHVDVADKWGSEPPCCLIGVERLTISDIGYCYSAVGTWLMLENINVISLLYISVISDKELVELSNGCQNITELRVVVLQVTSNMPSFSMHRPFQKLKILRFDVMSPETHASTFKILLSYSTMVTYVNICGLNIDDSTVETIFETNKMRYLQWWRMNETVCTSKTFYLLFNMCPMLRLIGKLGTWSIPTEQAQEIENFIRQGNYNLITDISGSSALLFHYMDRARELLLKMVPEM